MGELFGDWVDPEQEVVMLEKNKHIENAFQLRDVVFDVVRACPQHTFVFLTKNPSGLVKWSPFPKKCWIGVSATDYRMANHARYYLHQRQAQVKFLSFEPLLGHMRDRFGGIFNLLGEGISWVIIGAQSNPTVFPKIEWILDITNAADKAGIPVFIKNNLKPMLGEIVRQEYPKE